MKAVKLREHTDEELRQVHDDVSKELIETKIRQGWSDGAEQPLKVRTLRRDLARVKTVRKQRELNKDDRRS